MPEFDAVDKIFDLLTENGSSCNLKLRAAPLRRGGGLVYGGHASGLAQTSLTWTVPTLATVIGWRSCDHLGPVSEDDVLTFDVSEADRHVASPASLIGYRATHRAGIADVEPEHPEGPVVLAWRLVAATATAPAAGAGAQSANDRRSIS